tara:strand:+ start:246 stop:566 length:321 start_codon:yes stop_codon:yes gene_type:complete
LFNKFLRFTGVLGYLLAGIITPGILFFVSFIVTISTASFYSFISLPEKAILKGLTVLFYLGCIALHQRCVKSAKSNLNFKTPKFLEYLAVPWWFFVWLYFANASTW